MKLEVWMDVPGYEEYYEVSNQGRIRSLDRTVLTKNGQERFYKGQIFEGSDVKGYKIVCISRDGKQERFYIHQLVAMTFLNHTPNGNTLVIDHVDGDKLNNRVDNLQIVTHRQNLSSCHRKDRNTLTSEYIGVSYNKATQKWEAGIKFKGKKIGLGYFNNEIDAAKAYQKALSKVNDGTFNPDEFKPKWTSKLKGVSRHKQTNKWRATPTINGKQVYLGLFFTEEEAYQAIQNKLVKLS